MLEFLPYPELKPFNEIYVPGIYYVIKKYCVNNSILINVINDDVHIQLHEIDINKADDKIYKIISVMNLIKLNNIQAYFDNDVLVDVRIIDGNNKCKFLSVGMLKSLFETSFDLQDVLDTKYVKSEDVNMFVNDNDGNIAKPNVYRSMVDSITPAYGLINA